MARAVARDTLRGALGVNPPLVRLQSFPSGCGLLRTLGPGYGRCGDLPGTRASHPFPPPPAPHRLAVLLGRTRRGAEPLLWRVRHLRSAVPAQLSAGRGDLGLDRHLAVGTIKRSAGFRGTAVPRWSAALEALAACSLARWNSGCGGSHCGGVVARTDVQCLLYREPPGHRGLGGRQRSGRSSARGVLVWGSWARGGGLPISALLSRWGRGAPADPVAGA